MKTLFRMSVMLLLACSFQNCQDPAFESVESDVNVRAKSSKQTKLQKDRHVFTISHIAPVYTSPWDQFVTTVVGTGTIHVAWGDGTSENYDLGSGVYGVELMRRYNSPGRYLIAITGDLKNITRVSSSYGEGPFDDINLRPLTGLKVFGVSNISGPDVIDLSHNKDLEVLALNDISELREIRLPKQHSLHSVSIAANTSLTAATVDALINSVYNTAVKKQISWGFFSDNRRPDV